MYIIFEVGVNERLIEAAISGFTRCRSRMSKKCKKEEVAKKSQVIGTLLNRGS